MKYSPKVYASVKETYAMRRKNAEKELEARRHRIFDACPELLEVDRKIRETASSVVGVILQGGRNGARVAEIKKEVQTLKARRTVLLKNMGEEPDALEIRYTCDKCRDSGYIDAKPCKCLEDELVGTAFRLSQLGASLSGETFENFKLTYYSDEAVNGISPREMVRRNVAFCKKYVEDFKSYGSQSILMTGGVGLGKTHLASAIANKLIAKGKSVKYITAPEMFTSIDKDRFGRLSEDEDVDFLGPDLLIIDDLGSECVTSFSVSALFSVLNSRYIEQKATVITTNLTPRDFEAQYGDKIYSRIAGEYMILSFKGEDVRQQKRKASAK